MDFFKQALSSLDSELDKLWCTLPLSNILFSDLNAHLSGDEYLHLGVLCRVVFTVCVSETWS